MSEENIRDPLALAMFAAWCNCPADAIPKEYKGHVCEATMTAWKRVGDAARARFEADNLAKTEQLRIAIGHLEHMAAWIGQVTIEHAWAAYSFEALGEDMPNIKAAMERKL